MKTHPFKITDQKKDMSYKKTTIDQQIQVSFFFSKMVSHQTESGLYKSKCKNTTYDYNLFIQSEVTTIIV